MRATVAQWHAEALGIAHHNVCAHLAGGFEKRQRKKISAHDEGSIFVVNRGCIIAPIMQPTAGCGVLCDSGKVIISGEQFAPLLAIHRDFYGQAERLGSGLNHFDDLRVCVARDEEHITFRFYAALGQRHGFGCGSRFIEHGGIGHGHASEISHHGLEIDQSFHAALADLGLVGRVGGVPSGIFQNVAQDHAGGMAAVIALANEVFHELIFIGYGFHF